ncbi:MAG: nucleotide-binding protein, partial [Minicystis sp.]
IGTFTGTIDLGVGPLVSAGGTDIFLAKLDPTGATVWSKRFGDAADQVGSAVAVDAAGTAYITGSVKGAVDFGLGPLTNAGDPLTDVYLAAFSSSGTAIFSKRFASTFAQAGAAIAVNDAHEVLLAGTFGSSADLGCGVLPGAGGTDVFLAKVSSVGACLWSKRFGDAADQEVATVAYDGNGNALAGGRFSGAIGFGGAMFTMNAGVHGGFAVKLDVLGAHLFSTALGNTSADQEVQGIAADPSGNILLSGTFTGSLDVGGAPLASSGQGDLFVIKLDPGGSPVWSKAFGDASDQAGRALVQSDSNGAVLLAGHFQGNIDLGLGQLAGAGKSDLFAAKLDADGNALWSKRYGDASAQELGGLARAGDTSAVLVGNFQGTIDLGGAILTSKGSTDGFIAKLSTP